MSGDDEIIIRNGTFKRWLAYEVVFFGEQQVNYAHIEGGVRIQGKKLLLAAAAIALLLGVTVGVLVS